MTSLHEAIRQITAQATSFGIEQVSIDEALGRVLAQEVVADRDYPPFNRSAMDGYAVQSADLVNKKLSQLELLEHVLAGEVATQALTSGKCTKVMTGVPVPTGADTVIRIEDCQQEGQLVFFRSAAIRPGQNIARQGEDARKGDMLLKQNRCINAPAVSVLAVTGNSRVMVERLPEVAIVATGNEIIPIDAPVQPQQIRDSNSFSVTSCLKRFHIQNPVTALVPDDKSALHDCLSKLLQKDIIIISGGVSKGDADYVPEVLLSLGVKELFHQVKIKPGAPLWFGRTPNGGVVFGLPGNPLSVQIACRIFLEPYISACFKIAPRPPVFLPFATERLKKSKSDEFFPCQITIYHSFSALFPVPHNGSGDIAAALESDGIALHPANINCLTENMPVAFYGW